MSTYYQRLNIIKRETPTSKFTHIYVVVRKKSDSFFRSNFQKKFIDLTHLAVDIDKYYT